jgi:hypothetical protein
MARARGANAVMAAVFEATYGVTPGTGFRKLPFVSANLGEEQSLIESDLLGYGRDPLTPAYDVVSNESDIVVPMDHRNIGFWLKGLFGNPTTVATVAARGSILFSAQPAVNATITINGTAFTAVASGATGNQFNIGANLAATLTNIVTVLSASVVPAVQQATYTQTGGNTLVITRTVLGPTGNTFTLAASTTPASNCTVSGATLSGGANGHTFVSGTQTLPSMSIEVGLPDVPFFGMNYGARANSLSVQAQRSGLLSATVNVIAQGEATAITTGAGTPTALDVERFSQFQGSITRNGAVLGNIVSAELMYSNNLEKIEVIRSDGRIADIDPGIVKCSGNLNARFQDTSLLDQATARTPCEIAFGWTIDASRSLLFTAHRVFLPRGNRQIQGPGGIQMPFAWQAALDPVLNKTCTVVLTNDVASY